MKPNQWGYVYRLRRRPDSYRTRFLTFSCNNREFLFNSNELKDRFAEHLHTVSAQMVVGLTAWVIMPNHVHLLVDLGAVRARDYLQRLKSDFAKPVLAEWRRTEDPVLRKIQASKGIAFWLPGGGHDDAIGSLRHMAEVIDYIHLNPVRWNLTSRSVDWPWSSAREYAQRELQRQQIIETKTPPAT